MGVTHDILTNQDGFFDGSRAPGSHRRYAIRALAAAR